MAVWAAMRPKSSGVTSRSSIWSLYSASRSWDDLGHLGLAQLAGLRVDRGLAQLLLDLVEQLLLEVGGTQQLEDAEVAAVVVDVHARVLGGAGLLLVGRQQGVLERLHQPVGGDALLALEHLTASTISLVISSVLQRGCCG